MLFFIVSDSIEGERGRERVPKVGVAFHRTGELLQINLHQPIDIYRNNIEKQEFPILSIPVHNIYIYYIYIRTCCSCLLLAFFLTNYSSLFFVSFSQYLYNCYYYYIIILSYIIKADWSCVNLSAYTSSGLIVDLAPEKIPIPKSKQFDYRYYFI